MREAGRSLRETIQECFSEEEICDTAVSCDGTWKRRDYASLNGVATSISVESGKCLAYERLVKNCKACEMWVSRKATAEYEKFLRVPWRLSVYPEYLKGLFQNLHFVKPHTSATVILKRIRLLEQQILILVRT